MRILVLSHEYPPVGGGGGRVAQDLNQGFYQHGHEVKLLTSYLKGLKRTEVYPNYEVIRVSSLRKYAYRATLVDMAAYIVSSYVVGGRLIKKWRPDIIQGHFAVPAGAAAHMLAKKFAIPYFLTAHLGDIPGGVPEKTDKWFRLFYPFTKKIWEDADRIITVSSYTQELAKRSYPGIEPELIFNGVDIQEIKPDHLEVHDPIQVVFAGRFVKQKNPILIVEVLNQLKHLEWKCVMMGDGPLKMSVEQRIQDYGLQQRFSLPGWLEPQQVLHIYKESDILFMPSLSEGLPIAGVQAIAMGLVPVISNVGGCPDLVDPNHTGFLIEAGDLPAFINAIRTLLTNKALLREFKEANLNWARKFDLRAVIAQYEKVMQEIISTH